MNIKRLSFGFIVTFVIVFVLGLSTKILAQQAALPTFDNQIVQVFADKPNGKTSMGAGFIVTPMGTILTAAHVIFDPKTGKTYKKIRARFTIGDSLKVLPITLIHNFVTDTPSYDLAVLIADFERGSRPTFPFFSLGYKPKKGSQVLIAGFPKMFKRVPKRPVYRYGIIATHIKYNNAPMTILDLSATKGFSGSAVIDITRKKAAVFAVISGQAASETDDLSSAFDIPIVKLKAVLKEYNEKKEQERLN